MSRRFVFRSPLISFCVAVTFGLPQTQSAFSQETPPPKSEEQGRTLDQLRDDHLAISGRYERFERLLSQMADILGREDPERADLLRRAIGKGRETQIAANIEQMIGLLESRELGAAIERRDGVSDALAELLKMLQSEDRRSSVERERERLNGVLKEVRTLINEERAARIATQNAAAPSSAATPQEKASDHATQLLDEIRENDDAMGDQSGGASSESDPRQRDSEPSKSEEPKDSENPENAPNGQQPEGDSEQNPSQGSQNPEKPSRDRPAGDQPKKVSPPEQDPQESQDPGDSEQQQSPSQSSPSDPSQKDSQKDSQKNSQQQNSQQQNSQQQNSQQQNSEETDESESTPGRKQIEQARHLMMEALESLRKQQKDPALKKQDDALAELHEAAEQLEETLRQLREEEKEMILAALEARLQRLLAVQTSVYEGTVTLAEVPRENWLDVHFGQTKVLSRQQVEVSEECTRTVGLLREDGTSVSILLALEDVETDMKSVGEWLQQSRVTGLTQSVQEDIMETLKELIAAVQREMEEVSSPSQQSDPQSQDPSSMQKPSLVNLMAEIKVLRSLQMRVNRRTKQVDELLLQAESTDTPEIVGQVKELAERQQRLTRSARELAKDVQRMKGQ
ncbi:MAG: hypothetical protein KDA96_06135 [Planctomycetaceae bacterium]|nr:hypothetical protein [Planctomycetaceae bacterium]